MRQSGFGAGGEGGEPRAKVFGFCSLGGAVGFGSKTICRLYSLIAVRLPMLVKLTENPMWASGASFEVRERI